MATKPTESTQYDELSVLLAYYRLNCTSASLASNGKGSPVCLAETSKADNKVKSCEKATKVDCSKPTEKPAKPCAGKKGVISKSTLILEIKPQSIKTNLTHVEKLVRNIEIDGLEWSKASKMIPIAYGLQKLQIGAVIVDELVSTDDIVEKIEVLGMSQEQAADYLARREAGDDDDEDDEDDNDEDDETETSNGRLVQSAEIVSFQKL